MSRYTRDDARYWRSRPDDHNASGLYAYGPQPTEPFTSRLAELTRSVSTEIPEGPLGARQRMERERMRKMTLLERRQHVLESIGRHRPPR